MATTNFYKKKGAYAWQLVGTKVEEKDENDEKILTYKSFIDGVSGEALSDSEFLYITPKDFGEYSDEDLEEIGIIATDTLCKFYQCDLCDVCGTYFLDEDNARSGRYGNFVTCKECGGWINADGLDFIFNNINGEYYCSEECLNDDGYIICEECGEVTSSDDSYYIEDLERAICRSCFIQYDCFTCEQCGRLF